MSASSSLMRYQIMEALGSGAQGSTYRAIDRKTQKEVAVKVFQLKKAKGEWKAFDRFEQECRLLQSIRHPGIPRFIESFASEESGDFFLAMELIHGESLEHRIKQSTRPPLEQVKNLFDQALQILLYLHRHRPVIVHRDIKPANLLISHPQDNAYFPHGKLWLIDFGGVKLISASAENNYTAIGTFGYMAPEQLHGEATPASDVYALAASFAAFTAGIEGEKLPRQGLSIDLEPVIDATPFRDLLAKMLVPEPKQRLSNIEQVLQEFRTLNSKTSHQKRFDSNQAKSREKSQEKQSSSSSSYKAQQLAQPFAIPVTTLAKVKSPPFRLLLWMVSSLAAGVLTLAEAVIIPVIFSIWERSADNDEAQRNKMKKNRQDIDRSIRESRQALQYLTKETNPLRDKDGRDS